ERVEVEAAQGPGVAADPRVALRQERLRGQRQADRDRRREHRHRGTGWIEPGEAHRGQSELEDRAQELSGEVWQEPQTRATVAIRLPYWAHGKPSSRTRAGWPGRIWPSAVAGRNWATTLLSPGGTTAPMVSPAWTTAPIQRLATSPRRPLSGAQMRRCSMVCASRALVAAAVARAPSSRVISRPSCSSVPGVRAPASAARLPAG